MRKVYIDIATTGTVPELDRLVEIAATEVINGEPTGVELHYYISPDNYQQSPEAEKVNGYSNEFLKDKPRFVDIAKDLAKLFQGAELVCYGADFDLPFLKNEFSRLSLNFTDDFYSSVVDLRVLVKTLYPNQSRKLMTLFERFALNEPNNNIPILVSKSRRLVQLHQKLLSSS